MNWGAIGAVGEVLGAIGVILSLVYLALQIRQNSTLLAQNTEVARANAAVTSANYGAELLSAIGLDPEATRIWITGFARPEQLGDDELRQYDLLLISQIIRMDANLALLKSGTLDPEIHDIWDRMLDQQLHTPRFQRLWRTGAIQTFTTASLAERIRERLEHSSPARQRSAP